MNETHGFVGPLYVARHSPSGPARAEVVLAGPMSLERTHSYGSWVRAARFLADAGYTAWRFDYRGVGESLGEFSNMTFQAWREDLQAVIDEATKSGRPVYVVGLRMGALLAQKTTHDGLIAWEPPASGHAMLMDMLRRKLAEDYAENTGAARLTRDDYVAKLLAGGLVEVEGYPWSRGLFESADDFVFKPQTHTLVTGPHGIRIPKPVFWMQSALLKPDLSELFKKTREILNTFTTGTGLPALPLSTTAPGREIISVDALVGTAHLPAQRTSNIGYLFLNFGYVPRDGHGGLATHAASALAESGVPAFRVDLPALGDSPGDLPEHNQSFFDAVTSGAFVEPTLRIAERLKQRYALSGFVFGGLCGAAVSATLAAAKAPTLVKGLVLLEPEMYVTEPHQDDNFHNGPRMRRRDRVWAVLPAKRLRTKLFSYWGWMRFLTLENRFGRFIPLPRRLILRLVLDKSRLPTVTNYPLASAWQGLVARDMPVLVITASGKLREVFLDRINGVVLRGLTQRHVRHVRLAHTNHIFTTGGAIATVISHLLPWSRDLEAPRNQADLRS